MHNIYKFPDNNWYGIIVITGNFILRIHGNGKTVYLKNNFDENLWQFCNNSTMSLWTVSTATGTLINSCCIFSFYLFHIFKFPVQKSLNV